MNDEGMFLKASKDDEINGMEHSFFKIVATECSNETKIEGDPECSSEEDIRKYLLGKKL
jgi:hypothetical protein